MKTPIKKLFAAAYGKKGIPAFNVFNAEQILAVFLGAKKSKYPVIIQITPVACKYLGLDILGRCIAAVEELYPEVAYSVHLDHGDLEYCTRAINSGHFNSVMIDASHLDFDENVKITRGVVQMARDKGISVEAELGVLGGQEDNISIDEMDALYTNPKQAQEFVNFTGCQSLAIAAGTSHGAYKFSGGTGLQMSILKEIQKLLPDFPLVLHGASSVPLVEIKRINEAGGKLQSSARGIELNQLHEAIKSGVCKINIATDMRLIWTRIHREFFKNQPDKFDMVIPGTDYINDLSAFVEEKCRDLQVKNNKYNKDGR